jgi:nucleoside-diphosphate-sugar epimerase
MKTALIIGCGDIGQRVARLVQAKGATVFGLARSEESANRLQELNINPVRGDLSQSGSLAGVFSDNAECISGTDVYYFAPPPSTGTTDPHMVNFLSALTGDKETSNLPAKIILISTTAVYGDCQGEWITEEQPVNPQTDRGLRRLDAENTLRDWSEKTGVPVIILRVGGIYGAGRLPIERLKKGLPILKEQESPFTNRIHQDDLAQICVAAAELGKSGSSNVGVYNVSDGQPSTMSYYFKAVAKANSLPQPPEVKKAEAGKVMTAGMLSYLKESRRLDNKKMLKDLQVTLRYKNLEEGLIL